MTFSSMVDDIPGIRACWAVVGVYLDNIGTFVDAGTYGYFYIGTSSAMIGTIYAGDPDDYYLCM